MSTLGPAPSDIRRARRGGAASPGVTETLRPTRLTPEPIDASASNRVGELLQALGLGAEAVQAQTRLSITREIGDRQDEAEQIALEDARLAELERRARVTEQAALAQEEIERGLAARHAAEMLPTLREQIQRGELTVPEGMDVAAFVSQMLAEEAEGQTEGYADELTGRMTPSLISFFESQRTGLIEETKADAARAFANAASTGERIGPVKAAAKRLGLTDAEFFDNVLRPAAELAGANVEAVEKIAAAAPEQFKAETEVLVSRARAARADLERVQRAAVEDQAFKLINDGQYGTAEQYIHQRRGSEITEKDADRLLGEVRAARDRATAGASAAVLRAEVDSWTDATSRQAASMLLTADTSGGVLSLSEQTFTDSSGREHTRSVDQIEEDALPMAMALLAKQHADDPDQMLAQQAQVLSGNGLEYEPWTSTLRVGATAGLNAYRRVGEGETPPMPAATLAGFDLYRRLKVNAPAVLHDHMDSDTRLFYEMAELSLGTEGVVNLEGASGPVVDTALRAAAQATRNDYRLDAPTRRAIDDAVAKNNTVEDWTEGSAWINPFSQSSIKNAGDITALVRQRAQFYLRTMPSVSPDAAVKQAVQSVKNTHARSNGYLIPKRSHVEERVIDQVSRMLASRYAERYGDTEGVTAEDIVLYPAPGLEDQWMLRTETGRLAFGTEFLESEFLTSRQIMAMAREAVSFEFSERKKPKPLNPLDMLPDPELDALRPARGIE